MCVFKKEETERMQQLPGPGQMGWVVRSVSEGRGEVAYIPPKERTHTHMYKHTHMHLPYPIKEQLHADVIS